MVKHLLLLPLYLAIFIVWGIVAPAILIGLLYALFKNLFL
jgi:hypothetical protein